MNKCIIFHFSRPDGRRATIASDGKRHCTQADTDSLAIEFTKLGKAIAHLEARGYSIDIDNFKSI